MHPILQSKPMRFEKELQLVLLHIIHNQEIMMAAIDDLKAADAAETAEIATVSQALQDEIARIGTITVPVGASDADVAAVTADLNTHIANLQTIATALANVDVVAPTPVTPAS